MLYLAKTVSAQSLQRHETDKIDFFARIRSGRATPPGSWPYEYPRFQHHMDRFGGSWRIPLFERTGVRASAEDLPDHLNHDAIGRSLVHLGQPAQTASLPECAL
jgi:hypothetical protein